MRAEKTKGPWVPAFGCASQNIPTPMPDRVRRAGGFAGWPRSFIDPNCKELITDC
jgi:hypothetical protein